MRRHEPSIPDPPRADRPGDLWVCGHAGEGEACSHGPTPQGGCPGFGPCQPAARANGDGEARFRCTRPPCAGGPCVPGPSPDGRCGLAPEPCTPRRSPLARRRIAATLCMAASVGAVVFALASPWRRDWFAPGQLAQPHAQILGGQLRNDRCAACHVAAQGRLATWFGSGRAGHAGVSQSQLCVDCHHTTIPTDRARSAHNLTISELRKISATQTTGERTWHDVMPRPPFGLNDVECSACHREHGGSAADLTLVSSAQCQACHKDRFASFSDGHPDWGRWPYGRGGQIAFDHAAHRDGHFAKQGEAFNCRSCHAVATDGSIARTASFETSCAACHDQSLRIEASRGIDLVSLPTLDVQSARDHGVDIGPWPAAADGVDDVIIPPLMRMLLATDPDAAAAIDHLTEPAARLWDGPPSPATLQASAELAAAIRQLVEALAQDTDGAIERRLGKGAELIAGQLSPQTIAAAGQRWFTEIPPHDPQQNGVDLGVDTPSPSVDLLPASDDLLGGDPLAFGAADDPLMPTDARSAPSDSSPRPDWHSDRPFDPDSALPRGGWYRDDIRLAIRYRAAGHADGVLRAVLELAADGILEPSQRDALLAIPAVAACAECHVGVRRDAQASWRSIRSDADQRTFTRFSHRPHMNLPELSDCTHCHRVEGDARQPLTAVSATAASVTSGANFPRDFAPLEHSDCVRCHTPKAAGDSCTLCHRYHVDRPTD